MSSTDPQAQPSRSSDCLACPGRPVIERIESRAAEIGDGFTIRRALPNRRRRMVGAWCFLDHAGPASYGRGKGLNVGPHPHIGLQTFTWMIEGEILHRDSLGSEQVIRPGQVNLMTAGRGIAHAEDAVSDEPGRLHAAQLWIALPDRERHRAPSFHHYPDLPVLDDGGFRITVLAGNAYGQSAPAEIFSPLVGVDFTAGGAATTTMPLNPAFEHAAMVLSGAVTLEGEPLAPGTLLYLGTGRTSLQLRSAAATRLLLIGGEPFAEDILLWWNFVARSPEELQQATADWNAGRNFGEVHGSPSRRLVAPDMSGVKFKSAGA
ncbi:MAG: pirin family protein [Stenotrophobium sp.]